MWCSLIVPFLPQEVPDMMEKHSQRKKNHAENTFSHYFTAALLCHSLLHSSPFKRLGQRTCTVSVQDPSTNGQQFYNSNPWCVELSWARSECWHGNKPTYFIYESLVPPWGTIQYTGSVRLGKVFNQTSVSPSVMRTHGISELILNFLDHSLKRSGSVLWVTWNCRT